MKKIFLSLALLVTMTGSFLRSADLTPEIAGLSTALNDLAGQLGKPGRNPLLPVGPGVYVLTDVEGKWDKVKDFIDGTGIFEFDEGAGPVADLSTNTFKVKMKNPDDKFIFDGDALDNGDGSIKIIKFLSAAKAQNPDQVYLVLGNREINKLRLLRELLPDALILEGLDVAEMYRADRFRIPGWQPNFMAWSAKPEDESKSQAKIDDSFVEYKHGKADTDKILKLKWLFAATMGAGPSPVDPVGNPGAFENFKKELGAKKSDLEAYNGYIAFINGLLKEYFSLAQIIHYDPATGAVFVHGGISKDNKGYIPETSLGERDHKTLPTANNAQFIEWVNQLNFWGKTQIANAYNSDAPVEASMPLIEYQEPEIVPDPALVMVNGQVVKGTPIKNDDGTLNTNTVKVDGKEVAGNPLASWAGNVPNPISVVQNRPIDNFKVVQIDDDTARELLAAGVSKVILGHSPIGQVPVPIKSNVPGFVRIAADTSAKPNPSAVIKVTPEGVTVVAVFYPNEKNTTKSVTQVYSTQDAKVGTPTQVNGKPGWHISDKLSAGWAQAKKPDGTPLPYAATDYELKESE